jgi:HEAT repeat protein
MIAATADRRFLELLAGYLEDKAAHLSPPEAAEVGIVLGRLGGEATLVRWKPWLVASGVFRKGIRTPLALQVAAAMALAEIGTDAAGERLLDALDASEKDAGPWIGGAVAHWQRRVAERKAP